LSQKDFYQLLGVSKSSTADEIKKAYRKLAMQFHPDKNPGNKKAEDTFKEISAAYDVLSDPVKKKNYDQFGSAEGHPFGGGAGGPGGPFSGGFSRQQRSGPQDFSGEDPFSDIFGDAFGDLFRGGTGAGARQRRTQPVRGSDLRYTLGISFEEAATGTEKVIHFVRQAGAKEDASKLSVTVPAGVKDGQRLKLTGEGDRLTSGTPGDLYVIIQLQPHVLFEREDSDVVLEIPVAYTQAILGGEIEIPTLFGKAQIKIPVGTHTGQVLRLKGKGFPKIGSGTAGDMLVRILVDTPNRITQKEREMLEELSKSLGADSAATPLVKDYQEKLNSLLKSRKS
jgi:molecular chaperone DnaJ